MNVSDVCVLLKERGVSSGGIDTAIELLTVWSHQSLKILDDDMLKNGFINLIVTLTPFFTDDRYAVISAFGQMSCIGIDIKAAEVAFGNSEKDIQDIFSTIGERALDYSAAVREHGKDGV